MTYGVPAKPVGMRYPLSATSSASRFPPAAQTPIKQAEDDGQRVRRWCIAADRAVIVDVVITKAAAGPLGEISEVHVFLASSAEARPRRQRSRACGRGRPSPPRRCPPWPRLVGRRRRVQPVAELEAGVPQSGRRQQGLHPADVRGHRIVLLAPAPTGRRTPATMPTAPTPPRRSRSPCSPGGELVRDVDVLQDVRHDEAHHPVGCPLLDGEVGQPVPQEALTSKR